MPLESKFNKKVEKTKTPSKIEYDDNEEIHSSDEDDEIDNKQFSEEDENDEANIETPQDKRLKLAKLYLEEIEKEEQNRAEDKELFNNVSQRLTNEYLDNIGKLRRKVANDLKCVDTNQILRLKHKLHKLPVTTVCLTADNKSLFTGNKSAIVLKWNCVDMKVIGRIDCTLGRSIADEPGNDKKRRSQIWTLAISTDSKFLVKIDNDNKNRKCSHFK